MRLFKYLFLFFIACQVAHAQTETYAWKNVAIGGGGFVSGIVTSKTEQNLMYARTDVGGAYRWDAANQKWIPLLDWVSEDETGYLGVESIAIDPVATNKVYMLAGISYFNNGKTAILKSADYGNTFTVVDVTAQFKADGNGMGRQTGEKLVVDPNSPALLYCGTRSNGLFKSSNSGSTWTAVSGLTVPATTNGSNGISFIILDPSTGSAGSPTQTIIAGVSATGSNFFRSDNGGTTFTAVVGGPTTLMPHRAVLASDRNLYITYVNAAGPWDITGSGQVWKYNLQTGSWTNVSPFAFPKPFGGISVDPNNPLRLVLSSVNTYLTQGNSYGDRIFLSTNGGTTWTDVVARGFALDDNGISWINGNAIHWAGCVEFDPFNTKKAWIISGNGAFSTENIDSVVNVWNFQVRGLEETVPLEAVSIPNGPFVSVVGDYDGFRHTDVSQYSPIHSPRIGTTTGIAFASRNSNVMMRVGDKIFYSLDMGITWTECTLIAKKGSVAISADGSTFLHCPEGYTKTYRSTDLGSSWTAATGLSVSEARPVADPVNSSKFYIYNAASGSVMVSSNGGISFAATATLLTGGSKVMRAVPDREGDLWVALYAGGLTRSTNSGQTFAKVNSVTACSAVGFGKTAPGKSFPTIFIWGTVNGVRGLHRSVDEGLTWARVNNNDHEYGGLANGQFVVGDMNVYGRVYMSTAGRGIAYGETDQTCFPNIVTPYVQVDAESAVQSTQATVSAGGTVTLAPEPAAGGTWSWTGPAGFVSSNREVVLVDLQSNQMGIYTATHTNDDGCVSSDMIFTVHPPIVKAEQVTVVGESNKQTIDVENGTLQLTAEFLPVTTTNQQVGWSVSDTTLASISSAGVLSAIGNGEVVARATATDGSGVFGELTVTLSNQVLPVGLPDSKWRSLSVYPNPNRNQFVVELPVADYTRIDIVDFRGVVVYSQPINSSPGMLELKTSLAPGVYVGRLSTSKDILVCKIVIE